MFHRRRASSFSGLPFQTFAEDYNLACYESLEHTSNQNPFQHAALAFSAPNAAPLPTIREQSPPRRLEPPNPSGWTPQSAWFEGEAEESALARTTREGWNAGDALAALNGVDLVSAQLIDCLSANLEQERGGESPLSRERDRLLALESVHSPEFHESRWDPFSPVDPTGPRSTFPELPLAAPNPSNLESSSNLGSLCLALDPFDDIPSSVKSSQTHPFALESPVFGALDEQLGDFGVCPSGMNTNERESGDAPCAFFYPSDLAACPTREEPNGGILTGSDGPSSAGLAGLLHTQSPGGLEEHSGNVREDVEDVTVQDMTLEFEGK
jgi:hypothetical protein